MNVCLYLGLSFEKPFLEQVCFGREEVATESPETNYLHFMTLMMMKTTMTMLMVTRTMLMTTTSKTTRMRMMMRITAIECAARAGAAATARPVCRLAFLFIIVGFLYFVLLVFKYFCKINILVLLIIVILFFSIL